MCEERCSTCIFGPNSPITPERRKDYMEKWQRSDTFQNCHHGTVNGDKALMCRGFYDWCKSTGWEPTAIQIGERLERLIFVPVPDFK